MKFDAPIFLPNPLPVRLVEKTCLLSMPFAYLLYLVALKDILKTDFHWDNIFEPFPYSKIYSRFVKIYLSTPDQCQLGDWVGWVKSRFRGFLAIVSSSNGTPSYLIHFCGTNNAELR